MKLEKKEGDGINLNITKGKGHGTDVPQKTMTMLHHALKEAGCAGSFSYQVTGKYNVLNGNGLHYMQIQTATGKKLRINMKCGKGNDSTISGILWIPENVDFATFFDGLKATTSRLNAEQWESLFAKVSVEPIVGKEIPPLQTKGGSSMATEKTTEVVTPSINREVIEKKDNTAYDLFLLDVAEKNYPNHVFQSPAVKDLVDRYFQEQEQRGKLMGVLFKLHHLGLIRRVLTDAGNAWQISGQFLRSHGMVVPTELPEVSRTLRGRKKEKSKKAVGKSKKTPNPRKRLLVRGSAQGGKDVVAKLQKLKGKEEELMVALATVQEEIERISNTLSRDDLLKILFQRK